MVYHPNCSPKEADNVNTPTVTLHKTKAFDMDMVDISAIMFDRACVGFKPEMLRKYLSEMPQIPDLPILE